MSLRLLNSTGYPIAFTITQTVPPFAGAAGQNPQVLLSKNGGAFVQAKGTVIDVGLGVYWLLGNAADRDTLGDVVLGITVSNPNVMVWAAEYTVVPYDPFQQQPNGTTINVSGGLSPTDSANLATAVAYLKLLVNATVQAKEQIP